MYRRRSNYRRGRRTYRRSNYPRRSYSQRRRRFYVLGRRY